MFSTSGVDLDEACSCDDQCLTENAICDGESRTCVCEDEYFKFNESCSMSKYVRLLDVFVKL